MLAAKILVVLIVLWFVHRTLGEAWTQLVAAEDPWSFHFGWLAAAGVIYLLGTLPAGLFWRHVMRTLGQDVRLGETLRAYYIGHLGKYVPGKAMVVVLRAGLLRSGQVDRGVAAASVFVETLTMMASGAFIAAAILTVWFRDQAFLSLVAVGLMLGAGLPTLPPVFRFLVRLAGVGQSDKATAEKIARLGFATLSRGWAAMGIVWVMLGLSYWAVLNAMGVNGLEMVGHLPRYVAAVSLAMVAGFLSLIPGGLGVRDLILTQLTEPYFAGGGVTCSLEPAAAAVVSAVLLRVVWLLSELISSGLLFWSGRRKGSVPTPFSL